MSQDSDPRLTVEALLVSCTPEVYTRALKVRGLIFSVLPTAIEQLQSSVQIIVYGCDYTYAGQVCAVALFRSHLVLMFSNGAALADPDGLLQGKGKRGRYLRIQTEAEVDNPALHFLLEMAVASTFSALKNKKTK